ncbi:acyl-CoA carboxylase subunit beta [Micromonospora halophytica]|uniref:Acetyl-CoA carboxylase, carboxyltransferase component n=1 Tax=Micromonospora halophytica TaxID=47864 RepID=A0A1C5I865_9ACTN|nr:carboxyl transferase domain-containing protein [Micromonospora halophytica]SCG54051.1 Acetyl-CoA carboxylase, carboxyltransferase component [Micromonospora halophytica]
MSQEPTAGPVRADLGEVLRRQAGLRDEARAEATAKRHAAGRRTVRENLADLVDDGTWLEYGGLAVAAQRSRRPLADLAEATPADGVVVGVGRVAGTPIGAVAYDYTVLAGTQGVTGHRKTDRLLDVAAREGLPVVVLAEGGGGRPSDTDHPTVAGLELTTFASLAGLPSLRIGIAAGWCFAGNAALLGMCDVTVGVTGASIGMGGPAMVEAAGLGVVAPQDVGPLDVHLASGAVDLHAADDADAVRLARTVLGLATGEPTEGRHADQRQLRDVLPENRRRAYDVRTVLRLLFDLDSVLELRERHGRSLVTALARLAGRPVGVIANNPLHRAGAIDATAAGKATRFLRLCERMNLPVVSLCDTPGIMVGPDAERTGLVRAVGDLFAAGASLRTPLVTVVLRKAYGLGAMAMAGGSFHTTRLTLAWPTGEVGAMGLEGAVRLAHRRELAAIADDAERERRYDELVALAYERGRALSAAASFELDDVIDPAQTRDRLLAALC